MNRGLIISGGHVNYDFLLTMLKNNYAYVIAVDGGMNSLWVINIKPDAILGDFDSCISHALNIFRGNKVKEIRFEVQKDKTDTDLAIEHMIDRGIEEADIIGASGTRLDHTLANIMMLFKYESLINLSMMDIHNKIIVGKRSMFIEKGDYNYLSLLPMSDEVKGVNLEGVAYPLAACNLKRESSFGISNEIIGEVCQLSFLSGQLIVIQSQD